MRYIQIFGQYSMLDKWICEVERLTSICESLPDNGRQKNLVVRKVTSSYQFTVVHRRRIRTLQYAFCTEF